MDTTTRSGSITGSRRAFQRSQSHGRLSARRPGFVYARVAGPCPEAGADERGHDDEPGDRG